MSAADFVNLTNQGGHEHGARMAITARTQKIR